MFIDRAGFAKKSASDESNQPAAGTEDLLEIWTGYFLAG